MENDTIILLPAEPALAQQVTDYICRNRSFLAPLEPEREEAYFTSAYQRKLLEAEVDARVRKTSYRFFICLKDDPERIIGSISLGNVVWGGFRSAFLGYKLDKDCVNHGYMTMAVAMLVRYAFEELKLHRIEANVMPRNTASLRVLEKNGFACEGQSPYYLRINGVWEDHLHMVRLNFALHT